MTKNVADSIKQRRTVRGFKPNLVPDEILNSIFETAQFSASNCNTQPWFVTVVSGKLRTQLEQALLTEITSGKAPSPVFQPGDQGLEGVYKERQYACAADYYSAMNIERADKEKRTALMLKNWQFFGAPHVAFISMPATMGAVNAIDVGIYLQSLMLLMVEHGLASCPQGALALYPQPIKELVGIPEGHAIICGLSFGYADKNAQINTAHMGRAPLVDAVRFVS
ncbi:MAG: nitroreductase [Oceanicoccus sp.]|jgi:nitroreductase